MHQAQAEAAQAQARLRDVLDALPEGAVVLDAEGRFVLWNQKYAEIYHRSADLFRVGVRLVDTLRIGLARGDYPKAIGDEEAWLERRMASLMNAGGVRQEQQLSDGRWVMTEERRTSDGGIVGLRVDVTDLKRQAEDLRRAKDSAESANLTKSAFLANMSHEIRTPLNGVLGVADLLSRTPLDARQQDLVQTISSSARSLSHLLNDFLEVSRLDSGHVEIVLEPFRVCGLAQAIATLFEPMAQAKGLKMIVTIAPEAEGWAVGDEHRIRQVLTNLLSNALKFTEQGDVELRVDAFPAGDGLRYVFTVSDSGIGFSADQAGRLFARFTQADETIARRYGGAGLGLSICKQMAELMGGALTAQSVLGQGSQFQLEVWMAPSPAPVLDAPATAAEADAGEMEGLRILLADDNAINRKVVQLMLDTVGVGVAAVENGLEAVRALEIDDFDLVLMDLQMPVMDGLAAIRAIRAREAQTGAERTPIAVLSANALHEHREASFAAGADAHLDKPIDVGALISLVAETAARKAALADDAAAADRLYA